MICFVVISSIFLFGLAARILGSIGKALNAAIGVQRCESEDVSSFEKPPSVPVPEAVKKRATKRSDLNGPTDHVGPGDKSSVSVRAPSTANLNKPKVTFGGMRAGFLLKTPKKPQPKETTVKACADTPKTAQAPPQQQQNASQLEVNTSSGQNQKDPPRPTKAGQTTDKNQQGPPRPTTEARPTNQDHPAVPIYPALAQVRPILLPVPGTNQATLIWDGSQRAQYFLKMIVAAKRAAAGRF